MPIKLIDWVPVDTDTWDIIREYQMEIDFAPIDECTKQVTEILKNPINNDERSQRPTHKSEASSVEEDHSLDLQRVHVDELEPREKESASDMYRIGNED